MQERLNTNTSKVAVMHGKALEWIPSPLPGVERRLLYRVGGEQARATTLVRYAPGSAFSEHVHSGGEEFLVLQGVFEDDHGQYPAVSYVRNPPGSSHAPGASSGCTIFVKLRQFHAEDRCQLFTQLQAQGTQTLFESEHERVWVQEISADSHMELTNWRGLELLVLDGDLEFETQTLKPLSWVRLPRGVDFKAKARSSGARIWIKDASHDLGF